MVINHPEYEDGLDYDELNNLIHDLDDVLLGLAVHPSYTYTLVNALTDTKNYSSLITPHETETTLAWMMSVEGTQMPSEMTTSSTYRVVKFNCPVNINVYDSNDVLRASIIDDEVQFIEDGYISTYINENGEKCFCLPNNEEYRFEIIGTDEGTMSCSVADFDFEKRENIVSTNYYDIPVSKGVEISGILEEKILGTEQSMVTLKKTDGTEIEQSETIDFDEAVEYTVTVESDSESSIVFGGGTFYNGDFSKVSVIAVKGESFAGWYVGDELVSTELEYRFMVDSDCTLTAKFVSWPTVTWDVEGEVTVNITEPGATIVLPCNPSKDGYTFIGWTPEVPGVMPAEDLVFTAVFEAIEPDVPEIPSDPIEPSEPATKPVEVPTIEPLTTIPIEEATTIPVVTEPSTTKPVEEITTKPSTTNPVEIITTEPTAIEPSTEPTTKSVEVPTTKPSTELATKPTELSTKPVTSLVTETKLTVEIRNPSKKEIKYGDSIILHADIDGELPAGAVIEWTADNTNFMIVEISEDGRTCTVTPNTSGEMVLAVTVYDASGNVIDSDSQTMTSKAGFFQKLIAFFKKIFGLTEVIPEAFKGII